MQKVHCWNVRPWGFVELGCIVESERDLNKWMSKDP